MSTEIAQRMAEIGGAMRTLASRYQRRHGGELPAGACVREAYDTRTPFDELAEAEEAGALEGEEVLRIWLEGQAAMMEFLFADGPHPGVVMRRLYCWAKKYRPGLVWDAGYRELGLLLGESHGAVEWRVGAMIDEYAKARNMRAVRAPWQRSEEACANYAEAARGNQNRKKRKAKAKPGRTK